MTKQRLVKMTCGDRNILVKALRSAQESVEPELSGKLQLFIDRILSMPKRRLYLNDEEYQYATLCLNGMRNDYLAADRSCGGIDRLLLNLSAPATEVSSADKELPLPRALETLSMGSGGFFVFTERKDIF